jgi:hypothetical protein
MLGPFADDQATVCAAANHVGVSALFTMWVRGRATPSKGSAMFTKDARAGIPAAQNFHPEFGYLCPSARMRRKVRSAAMTVLAGMVIAAGTVLALVPQLASNPPGEGGREESALSTAAVSAPIDRATVDRIKVDRVAVGKAPDDRAMPVILAPSIPMTYPAAPLRAQASCDDLSGSFLLLRCQSSKPGKLRMTREARAAHAASRRVANMPIGRIDAEPETEQHAAAAPRPAPAAEAALALVATNAAAAGHPPEKPAAPAKRPVKTMQKPVPSRDNAGADALAAAPSPGFGLFGLFREPLRIGIGGAGNGSTAGGPRTMSW